MIPISEPLLHYFALTCSQKSPDLTQTSANHVPDSVLPQSNAITHLLTNPSYSPLKSTGPCTHTCNLKIESSVSISQLVPRNF